MPASGLRGRAESAIEYLRYNMRSQIFAKALPMPLVVAR
jgi:hypothetical protein